MFDTTENTIRAQGIFRNDEERLLDNARVERLKKISLGVDISIDQLVSPLVRTIIASENKLPIKLLFLQVLFHYDSENTDLIAAIQSLLFQQRLTGEVVPLTNKREQSALRRMKKLYAEEITELLTLLEHKRSALTELFYLSIHEQPKLAYAVCCQLTRFSADSIWEEQKALIEQRLSAI